MSKRRVKKQTKPFAGQRSWVVLFCLAMLGAGYTGVQVVDAAADTRAIYQRLGEVQREENELLEETSRLSLERSSISSLQKVEQVAEQQLDMEFPTQLQGITQ